MKAGFQTTLDVELKDDSDGTWIVKSPLKYWSEILDCLIVVPYWFESKEPDVDPGFFETDFASVPRVPFIYESWGNRAHREAVLHDYLYRKDSKPVVTYSQANKIFLEAMKSRGVQWWIRWPMYLAVCMAGWTAYHKLCVKSKI